MTWGAMGGKLYTGKGSGNRLEKFPFLSNKEITACADPLAAAESRGCPYPALKKVIVSVREKKTAVLLFRATQQSNFPYSNIKSV